MLKEAHKLEHKNRKSSYIYCDDHTFKRRLVIILRALSTEIDIAYFLVSQCLQKAFTLWQVICWMDTNNIAVVSFHGSAAFTRFRKITT